MHILLFVDTKSEVTEVPDPVSERAMHHLKALPAEVNHVNWPEYIRDYYSIDGAGCCLTSQATLLDFWLDLTGQFMEQREQAWARKPMLLSGVPFYAPWSDDFYKVNFHEAACTEWGQTMGDHEADREVRKWCKGSDPSFCDLAAPTFSGYDKLVLSHKFNRERVEGTFRACAETLDKNGYRSFYACK